MAAKEAIIQTFSLTKTYKAGFWGRPHTALQGLDLIVPRGSIFGFLGANGAGKTTTIKLLLGLQYATSGKLSLFGEENVSNSVRSRIGYLPERPILHADLTGNEFLNFHRNLFGTYLKKSGLLSNSELLELVGVPEVGDRLLREFSKGMLQRVGIAQSLVNDPDLVILDEPMSGLDPVGRRDVRNLISNLRDQGKTIFFSSHILSDVESICDEIAFLEKGNLKSSGSIGEILSNAQSRGVEIVFQGINEAKLRSIKEINEAHRLGKVWKLELNDEEQVRYCADAIWKNGGKIESINKVSTNLEKALFKTE